MSLFSVISISASGMAAQRVRSEVLVENIANSETTRTPGGGPYRRKDVVFSSESVASPFASELHSQLQGAPMGVKVSEITVDNSERIRSGEASDRAWPSRRAGSIMCGAVIALVPFEGAVEGSLERSRDGRAHVQHDTLAHDHVDRVTPL